MWLNFCVYRETKEETKMEKECVYVCVCVCVCVCLWMRERARESERGETEREIQTHRNSEKDGLVWWIKSGIKNISRDCSKFIGGWL